MKCIRFFLSMPFAFGLVHMGSESPLKGKCMGSSRKGKDVVGKKCGWVKVHSLSSSVKTGCTKSLRQTEPWPWNYMWFPFILKWHRVEFWEPHGWNIHTSQCSLVLRTQTDHSAEAVVRIPPRAPTGSAGLGSPWWGQCQEPPRGRQWLPSATFPAT